MLRTADGERGHSQATQAPRSLTVEVCGAVGCRGGAVSIATAPLHRQDCPPLPPQVSTRLVHLHGSGRHESPSQSAHNRLYIYCIKVYSFRPATPARAARFFACMRLSPSRRRHSPWRGRTWWCHCTSQWAVRMQNLHWDKTQRPENQRRGGMKEREERARGCASRGSRG